MEQRIRRGAAVVEKVIFTMAGSAKSAVDNTAALLGRAAMREFATHEHSEAHAVAVKPQQAVIFDCKRCVFVFKIRELRAAREPYFTKKQ
jgi:hypothetical protein